MTTRLPAVAGMFYEADPARLRAQVAACFAENEPPPEREPLIAAVVPHAGLMYSGHVAAALYGAAELPKRLIILCPNHTGAGHVAATYREGSWKTPFGDVSVDVALAEALTARMPLLQHDVRAHAREHSLEVQLPFLQQTLGDFTFVPICLSTYDYDLCFELGNAIADVIAADGGAIAILASSDLNHYEDQQITMRKDFLAIDRIVALDPRGLWNTVEEEEISMCGFIPTTVALIAATRLGATRARLLKHATSGDINNDYARVVGYAAVTIS